MTNNREVFLKWTKNLLYLECAILVLLVLEEIPIIGSVFDWINTIAVVATIYALYKLGAVSERYKKAAVFRGISLIISFLIGLIPLLAMLAIVGAVCSLIGLYQEFCGHAEMLNGINETLSRKWHSLFNWNIFGGIVLGILATPLMVVFGVLLHVDTSVLTAATLVLITGFDVILKVFYLLYLKRTREAYI